MNQKILIPIMILSAFLFGIFAQSQITGQALWTKQETYNFGETGCVLDSDCITNNCELTEDKYSTTRICTCPEFEKWDGKECVFDSKEYYTKDNTRYAIAWTEGLGTRYMSTLYLKLIDKNLNLIKEIKISNNVNNKSIETKTCEDGTTMITWQEGNTEYYTRQYLEFFDKTGESIAKIQLNNENSLSTSIAC